MCTHNPGGNYTDPRSTANIISAIISERLCGRRSIETDVGTVLLYCTNFFLSACPLSSGAAEESCDVLGVGGLAELHK